MQTILGAGGPIANALQKELETTNEQVKLVSRRTIIATGNTSWQKADLTNYNETLAAAQGSKVIYLCAGLVYDTAIWQQQWPIVMQNAINVAKETKARLIFFDNVYMYGLVKGNMLETTPDNPCSKKGEVRAKIAHKLMQEIKDGNIRGSIARAPDFYGAGTANSYFDSMLLSKFAKKESAQWLGNPKTLHAFILVEDAAKAVALLGKSPESDNQIWHLPTAPAITGIELVNLAAKVFDTTPKYMKISKPMMQLFGLFSKPIKNSVEMFYQYANDYQFNSDKFQKAFNVKPTSYQDGFKKLAETLYKN